MIEVSKALAGIFSTLKSIGAEAGADLRLGSLNPLFMSQGVSQAEVDDALEHMLRAGWLSVNRASGVRPGGHCLTEAGAAEMRSYPVANFSAGSADERWVEVSDSTIDGPDHWEVIAPVSHSVSVDDGQERYEQSLTPFTKEQRFVFACAWYLSQIGNGGHDQFYFNSAGIVWKDALEGFAAMGLKECSEVVAESARRLGGAPAMNRAERWSQLERMAPEFDDLDARIWGMNGDFGVEQRIMEFIRENRSKFHFAGKIPVPAK